jgi:rhamnose utilization protein RhaD (predicted bifunctional aldolase and dehydrogenase)
MERVGKHGGGNGSDKQKSVGLRGRRMTIKVEKNLGYKKRRRPQRTKIWGPLFFNDSRIEN